VETMEFAEMINADIAQFTVATPYPGTRLHKWAEKNKYIIKYNDDKITGYEALMRNENLTAEQIMVLRNAVQTRFNHLKEIKERNKRELASGSVLVRAVLGFFVGKAKKKIVVYGAKGIDPLKFKAKGYELLGITDERYFGEKIGDFTVLHPVIIPLLKPDAVVVSPLKRAANIRQYTEGVEMIDPLILLKETVKKLKG
jgi:hypothetical protein